jgi:outer membrane lipoprotein-sorting protein
MKKILACFWLLLCFVNALAQSALQVVSPSIMQSIYTKIKTPYKYGLVVVPKKNPRKLTAPLYLKKMANGL